ncbi:MAG: flagellar basal body L-ring protein FlgH [Proteobacteria bacterium]|nr:flagellar basal body L-ring protein FlgH [Burkholderiales bacterium]
MTLLARLPALSLGAFVAGAVLALLTAGCSSVPPTNVHQPMTARPEVQARPQPLDGAIFQDATARLLLFNDRRARFVGDTITVTIEERLQASNSTSSNASREGAISASVPTVSGLPFKTLQGLSLGANSSNSHAGSGGASTNNTLTGNVAVTVIEVYPNGNLLVSGEKQVSIGTNTEYIRFSGVINPASVTAANTVSSTRVADARIEFRGAGYISEAQRMAWLARLFLTFLPF